MPVMLIFILFSGFYANNSIIPAALNWIQWISPVRWFFASVVTVQFSGLVFVCDDGPDNCIQTGDEYIARFKLQNDSFGRSFGVLIGMIAFLQVMAYFTLRVKRIKWMTPQKVV